MCAVSTWTRIEAAPRAPLLPLRAWPWSAAARRTGRSAPGLHRIGYIDRPMTTVTVPADAPPMFNGIVEAWRNARRPVEPRGRPNINQTSQTPLPAASRAYSEKHLGFRPRTRSISSVT